MVARLRAQGLHSEPVLAALAAVPRHAFVDTALISQAYEDTSLPIGLGQTISKPSVVGRMIELLLVGPAGAPRALGKVLEIGTGCGYQAALLSHLATQVVSIERLKPLHDKARELLAPLRRHNLRLVYGDGRTGHGPNAPYDSIIAAAGGEDIPPAWLEQLAVGGRLVAPMQSADGRGQVLVVVDRQEGGYARRVHEAVHFVPLKSGVA
jgi:protein-L-isoaspartate(D-aspartate) O-methyltransferase